MKLVYLQGVRRTRERLVRRRHIDLGRYRSGPVSALVALHPIPVVPATGSAWVLTSTHTDVRCASPPESPSASPHQELTPT